MTEKDKMIEEMKKHINNAFDWSYKIGESDIAKVIAEELSKHYQPKIPEGSVVLSEEEYKNDFCSQFDKGYKIARKETAETYHKAMRKIIHERDYIEGYAEIGLQEENDEIARQYGVEV